MIEFWQFVFSSPWVFLGTVVLASMALVMICLTVAGFSPKVGRPPQTLPRSNPWA